MINFSGFSFAPNIIIFGLVVNISDHSRLDLHKFGNNGDNQWRAKSVHDSELKEPNKNNVSLTR